VKGTGQGGKSVVRAGGEESTSKRYRPYLVPKAQSRMKFKGGEGRAKLRKRGCGARLRKEKDLRTQTLFRNRRGWCASSPGGSIKSCQSNETEMIPQGESPQKEASALEWGNGRGVKGLPTGRPREKRLKSPEGEIKEGRRKKKLSLRGL